MTNEEVRAKLEQVIALTTTLTVAELTPEQRRGATRVIDECGWALYYAGAGKSALAYERLSHAVRILDWPTEG